jgi:hypothetical protein
MKVRWRIALLVIVMWLVSLGLVTAALVLGAPDPAVRIAVGLGLLVVLYAGTYYVRRRNGLSFWPNDATDKFPRRKIGMLLSMTGVYVWGISFYISALYILPGIESPSARQGAFWS